MNTKSKTIIRTFTGEVVSTKMDKTIVVRVDRTMVHAKYGKRYKKSRKFHVHNENGEYAVGDKVSFRACRPYSKMKRWIVVKAKS